MDPRALTPADLDWVTGLAAARRARLAPFAPRFWNPSRGARAAHERFLGRLIDSPNVMSVRTEHGFLFGLPEQGLVVVDDMAVEDDACWPDDGVTLLRHVSRYSAALRFVCPVPEQARADTARSLGLTVTESWWHRDLDARTAAPAAGMPAADLGEECRLVPAPPVYDPGGPVLLVTRVPDAASLASAEQAAAARGATVSVVSQGPADHALAGLLTARGYRRTTDHYFAARHVHMPGPLTNSRRCWLDHQVPVPLLRLPSI